MRCDAIILSRKPRKTAEAMKAPARVIDRIKKMQKHWDYDYSPEEALQILFSSYGLKRGG